MTFCEWKLPVIAEQLLFICIILSSLFVGSVVVFYIIIVLFNLVTAMGTMANVSLLQNYGDIEMTTVQPA